MIPTDDIIKMWAAHKITEAEGDPGDWRTLRVEFESQNDYCWSEFTHDPAFATMSVYRDDTLIAEMDGCEDFGGFIRELLEFAATVES